MGLRKHAIEWEEQTAPQRAAPIEAAPSPALMLQELLAERSHLLTRPALDREQFRKLVMMLAAGSAALWMGLIMTATTTVSLIA